MKQAINALPHWRSILFVPAHVERFVHSAHSRGADAIQLDLEDSVPSPAKAEARQALPPAVERLVGHGLDILVRINRELRSCALDLEAAVIPGVKAITLPKVIGPDHILLIDETVTELEHQRHLPVGGIKLIAMIETVAALLNVEQLARACPRLAGITLGSEDFSYDGGFAPTPENLFHPCQRLIYAARTANIQAYGFPGSIADYRDTNAFRALISQARAMGFRGAFCIHPEQVRIVNEEFRITDTEIEQAQRIIAAYETALASGRGAVEVDGKMVDLPVVERARGIVAAKENQPLPRG
jgi:citrate lyase subunit beta / citryl-CoA lyase